MKHLKQEVFTTSFLQAGVSIQVLYFCFMPVPPGPSYNVLLLKLVSDYVVCVIILINNLPNRCYNTKFV